MPKINWLRVKDRAEQAIRDRIGCPSVEALASVLFDVCRGLELYADTMLDEDAECDVRLQVHNGSWALHTGPSDYDQDHRGHWGCSGVSASPELDDIADTADAMVVAEELINQVLESVAMSDEAID